MTGTATATLHDVVDRLSRQSVLPGKHFDAYVDVPWDEPGMEIDPDDPRWELGPDTPLGSTDWYRSQPASVRSRIGLHDVAAKMKAGLEFESVLKRGLLEFASTLPNRTPLFRYAYHEVIEEAQHSLMFQEFVNRTGFDPPSIPKGPARRVVRLGRTFPELFFVFVLGGEDPIDYVQRRELRSDREIHPLLERIMRIHVTEEARHLSFARQYLRATVPDLGRVKRARLALGAPSILGVMSKLMLQPSSQLVRTYGIPKPVIREAFAKNPEHRAQVRTSLRKVRDLLGDLGLTDGPERLIWKSFGLWE